MSNYVDNQKFVDELVAYKEQLKSNPDLPVPRYIGECILEICRRFASRPNFYGYSYRDEMVSDAIENCLQYLTNFDPAKSNNAFSYYTQIAYFAFIRRIAREKKQSYIKHRLIQDMPLEAFSQNDTEDAEISQSFAAYIQSNSAFDHQSFENKLKRKKKELPPSALELFMVEDEGSKE